MSTIRLIFSETKKARRIVSAAPHIRNHSPIDHLIVKIMPASFPLRRKRWPLKTIGANFAE